MYKSREGLPKTDSLFYFFVDFFVTLVLKVYAEENFAVTSKKGLK